MHNFTLAFVRAWDLIVVFIVRFYVTNDCYTYITWHYFRNNVKLAVLIKF